MEIQSCVSFIKLILDLVIFNLILSDVIAFAETRILVPTVTGLVNTGVLAAVDIDPDIPNDCDNLGLGSLLPGPILFWSAPIP
jgi:hypothetical protein